MKYYFVPGIVVGSIFLSGDQLLGVEEFLVGAGADLKFLFCLVISLSIFTSSTTVGSRSMKMARGTCFPENTI